MNNYDVIVIGGGASGMMAAGRAAERGRRVLLLEKNEQLGAKLSITGGGRCNILNADEDVHRLLGHYGTAKKFLYSPFAEFGVEQTMTFFERHGLPLKIEAGQRAFPKSERAIDVVHGLIEYMKQGNVGIRTDAKVQGLIIAEGKIIGVKVNNETLTANSYIIATGGKSHPETGSTGDGFVWLKGLGLSIKQPTPTVVPLKVSDPWIKSLASVAMNDVKVTFSSNGTKAFAVNGRILFTHFGLSGPLILNSAGKVADFLHAGPVIAKIDVYPKLDIGALDKHLTKIFEDNKNRELKNVMKIIAPTATAAAILTLIPQINPERQVNGITRVERKMLVDLLKALPVTITGLMGLDRAVVTDGGLSISEVEGKTMRVRRHQNLFVTGDLLNISRPSGGFSLQLCWTTGWIAGENT